MRENFCPGQNQCCMFNMIDAHFAEKLRKCVCSSVVLDDSLYAIDYTLNSVAFSKVIPGKMFENAPPILHNPSVKNNFKARAQAWHHFTAVFYYTNLIKLIII